MFYCELLSGLWIGDTDILMNEQFIKENNISIILNCTQLFDFPKKIPNLQKIRLPFSPIRESNDDIYLIRQNKDTIIQLLSKNIAPIKDSIKSAAKESLRELLEDKCSLLDLNKSSSLRSNDNFDIVFLLTTDCFSLERYPS